MIDDFNFTNNFMNGMYNISILNKEIIIDHNLNTILIESLKTHY